MANKNMIKVYNKSGKTTHFNRAGFLRITPLADGSRNGWFVFENAEAEAAGIAPTLSTNVPEELKVFKPGQRVVTFTQEEVDKKIEAAIAALPKAELSSTEIPGSTTQVEAFEKVRKEIGKMEDFLLERFGDEILEGSVIDNAVRLFEQTVDKNVILLAEKKELLATNEKLIAEAKENTFTISELKRQQSSNVEKTQTGGAEKKKEEGSKNPTNKVSAEKK